MKIKNITAVLIILISGNVAFARDTLNVHEKNGGITNYLINDIDSVIFYDTKNTSTIVSRDTAVAISDTSYTSVTTSPTLSDTTITARDTTITPADTTFTVIVTKINTTNTIQTTTNIKIITTATTITTTTTTTTPIQSWTAQTDTTITQMDSTITSMDSLLTSIKDTVVTTTVSTSINNTTDSTVTDIQGNVYKTVKIGNQVWMAENLNVTKYNDNTAISLVTDDAAWENTRAGAYCYYDNDAVTYSAKYGALYNWYAVDTKKLCPAHWHVPSDAEWTVLHEYVKNNGHSGTEGKALKATSSWYSTGNGSDDFGFNSLPSGYRWRGSFQNVNTHAGYLASDNNSTSGTRYMRLTYYENSLYQGLALKYSGYSIRCVKD